MHAMGALFLLAMCALLSFGCAGGDTDDERDIAVCMDEEMPAIAHSVDAAMLTWNLALPSMEQHVAIPPRALDLRSVVIHELGHRLGFEHNDDPQSTMFPVIFPGESRRGLSPDIALMFRDDLRTFVWAGAHDACDVRVHFSWNASLPLGKLAFYDSGDLWINPQFTWLF